MRVSCKTFLTGGALALGAAWLAAAQAGVAPAATEVRPLLIGSEVPELTLTAANGDRFDLRSDKPTVFVFYRGGW